MFKKIEIWILYFNSNGTLRWEHVNRAENEKIYALGWAKLLYTENDILKEKIYLQTN